MNDDGVDIHHLDQLADKSVLGEKIKIRTVTHCERESHGHMPVPWLGYAAAQLVTSSSFDSHQDHQAATIQNRGKREQIAIKRLRNDAPESATKSLLILWRVFTRGFTSDQVYFTTPMPTPTTSMETSKTTIVLQQQTTISQK